MIAMTPNGPPNSYLQTEINYFSEVATKNGMRTLRVYPDVRPFFCLLL